MPERRPPNKSETRGGWRAYVMSVLLHTAIVAAAVFGWFTWKHEPPAPQSLAIEATVVDARSLAATAPPPTPEPTPEPPPPTPEPPPPEPAPVEEQGPPKPDPAEIERKAEAEKRAQEAREKEQREEAERKAEVLAAQKEAAEKAAAEKAAAEKAAAEKAAAEKRAAEKKRAEDARKAAEEKARQAREAELRARLEAEERADAARNSDDAARWHAQIVARITRAWTRPPSARAGIQCTVLVNQVPGGEVTGVRVVSCTGGDAALRESVETAVYRASPLPTPPPGVPFERNLELTFAPNE